jgi:hypothetical protein
MTEPDQPTGRPPTEVQHVARLEAEDRNRATHGQRRINLIWEVTQSIIAIMVSGVTLVVSALVIQRSITDTAAFLLLSNAFFLVIGFYFGRTNHEKTGGISPDDRR